MATHFSHDWGHNHIVSHENTYQYISDYLNTISTILYITLPLHILYTHPEKLSMLCAATLIGVGSAIFYTTSQYYGAMLDESFILFFVWSAHAYLQSSYNSLVILTSIVLYFFYLFFNHFILFHSSLLISVSYLYYQLQQKKYINNKLLHKALFYLFVGKLSWLYEQYMILGKPSNCGDLYFLNSTWHICFVFTMYSLIHLT